MSHRKHRLLRKQDGYPLSGSIIESDPTPTDSLLAQDTATPTLVPPPSGVPPGPPPSGFPPGPSLSGVPPGPPPSGAPPLPSSVLGNSTSALQFSSPTASVSSSTSSGNQISMATVIGSCVAALIALLLAVLLAFYCSKRHKKFTAYAASRNAANKFSQRRSRLEPWRRIHDSGDLNEVQEKRRPLSGPLGAMFHRTISNSSGEKSLEGHNRESVGTMRNFAKYHPGLAAEMASQSAIKGVGGKLDIVKPAPVLRLMGRSSDMPPPISLDGDTLGKDSFFSLHSSLSNSMSHTMTVSTERSTPPAVTSSLHHWESAEVLHVSQLSPDLYGVGGSQNPFSDKASSVKSRPKTENPFFSAREHLASRTLLPDTHDNPFADTNTPRDSAEAIRSLIAALEAPEGQDNDRIVSFQSSLYSRMTTDDGDSAISVTAFPSPPSQIKLP